MTLGSFVGRTKDLASLAAHIERGARLISIIGPPGVGKTRLVREFVAAQREVFPAHLAICFLSTVTDPDELPEAVARVFESMQLPRATAAERVAAVGRALAAHGRTLLVLDNIEQVIHAAASAIQTWLELAPDVFIVTTSRETLRIPGEVVHDLEPLPEGVELFLERARRLSPGYASDKGDLEAIAELVTRLDNLPLAIELAASRARLLDPKHMLSRIERRFELLSISSRAVTGRHVTLRNAIGWSWDLLDEHERLVLSVVSVFHGGFSVESAEQVLGELRALLAPDALALLQALVDKSLLRRGTKRMRLFMLETIGEFAREQLLVRGEADAANLAHARHYLRLFASMRASTPFPDELRAKLDIERPNIRAILTRFSRAAPDVERSTLALRAAIALSALSMDECLSMTEALHVDDAIEQAPAEVPPGLLAEALLVRVAYARLHGGHGRMEADARRALELAELSRDESLLEVTRRKLGAVLFYLGRMQEALEELGVALLHARLSKDPIAEIENLGLQGCALYSLGRQSEALELFHQGLALCHATGYRRGELRIEGTLAFHEQTLLRDESALARHTRTISLAQEIGSRRMVAISHAYLGLLHLEFDRLPEADTHLAVALATARQMGDRHLEGCYVGLRGIVHAAKDDINAAASAFALAREFVQDNPFSAGVYRIHEGHLDLARCRAALAVGDLSTWALHRASVRLRIEQAETASSEGSSLIDRSDDARMALRLLLRNLDRLPHPRQTHLEPLENGLRVAKDGSWFEVGGGPRVEITNRTAHRLILSLLIDRTLKSPGEAIASREIVELVWPGQKLSRSDARNRLHVTLNALRKLGLRGVIEWVEGGYRINPRMKVSRG